MLRRWTPNDGFTGMQEAQDGGFILYSDINTPETEDFIQGVIVEAAHQRDRWPSVHDAGKTPADWFWLVGYVAGKALHAAVTGNMEKMKHHIITTAAVLLNWHLQVIGKNREMRPGIGESA
jgi:hypothetical protein